MFLDIKPDPEGMPPLVFNKHYDAYMLTGELNPEALEYMNIYQLVAINELKKSFNRFEAKYGTQRQGGRHQGEEIRISL
jgi:hypothetical protein